MPVDAENSSSRGAVFVAVPLDPLTRSSSSTSASSEIKDTATPERNHRNKRVDDAATFYWIFVSIVVSFLCMHFISYCYWMRQTLSSSSSASSSFDSNLKVLALSDAAGSRSGEANGWKTVEVTESPMEQVETHAIELASDTYYQFLSDNPTVMIHFYAPFFGNQYLYPTWQQFALKVQEKQMSVAVGQVDCSKHHNLCPLVDIQVPSVVWFQNGVAQAPPVYEGIGDFTVDRLIDHIASKLGQNSLMARWTTEQ